MPFVIDESRKYPIREWRRFQCGMEGNPRRVTQTRLDMPFEVAREIRERV